MRNWTRIVTPLAAAALLATGASALAHGPGGGYHGKSMDEAMPHMHRQMAKRLQLTEPQREQMRAIRESAAPEMRALHEELRQSRRKLRELATAETYDEQAVRSEAQRLGDLTAQLAELGARTGSQAHQLLTPEQQAELSEMRQQAHQRHAERHSGHHSKRQRDQRPADA